MMKNICLRTIPQKQFGFSVYLNATSLTSNNDNVVTFYDTARTVEDTRGELLIQKSHGLETSLEAAGFTPAQFLASSHILVENVGFAEVLMLLLEKRLRISMKCFPVSCGCIDDEYISKPYCVLQVQNKAQRNAAEVNQQ
jgi:hypothetical protein